MRMFLFLWSVGDVAKIANCSKGNNLNTIVKAGKTAKQTFSCCISPLQIPICCHLHYTSLAIEKIAYFMKLVGWEQLATQGVPRWQVHKRVAGGSQRRGSVASPV